MQLQKSIGPLVNLYWKFVYNFSSLKGILPYLKLSLICTKYNTKHNYKENFEFFLDKKLILETGYEKFKLTMLLNMKIW